MDNNSQESLVEKSNDPLIRFLNKTVIFSVKILAVIMVIVIWLALISVAVHLFERMITKPFLLFDVETLITTLGDFLAVLIAIEIFLNIVFYLKKDAVHVPLVLATALTAAARKVIILDYTATSWDHLLATAAVIFAVGITYWLVTKPIKE
jgi:uncharacterized membrane protein (DUF373 family)